MLTGVTRPFHAPHALSTPSTGGTSHGPRPRELNPTGSIHDTILRSRRHERRHESSALAGPSVLDRTLGRCPRPVFARIRGQSSASSAQSARFDSTVKVPTEGVSFSTGDKGSVFSRWRHTQAAAFLRARYATFRACTPPGVLGLDSAGKPQLSAGPQAGLTLAVEAVLRSSPTQRIATGPTGSRRVSGGAIPPRSQLRASSSRGGRDVT